MNNSIEKMRSEVEFRLESEKSLAKILPEVKMKLRGNTRKLILLVSLVFLCTSFTFGQIKLGVVGGINASTQSGIGNIWDNEAVACNIQIGLMPQYQFNDWFAMKSGLMFSQKGRSIDILSNGLEQKQKDRFSYLEIPIKAEFSAPSGNKDHRLFASVGPYAALLLDSKKKIDDQTYDLEGQTKDSDFGLSIGFGVEYPLGKNSLQLLLNYDMGFSEIAEYDSDLRNKSLSLSVGWYF